MFSSIYTCFSYSKPFWERLSSQSTEHVFEKALASIDYRYIYIYKSLKHVEAQVLTPRAPSKFRAEKRGESSKSDELRRSVQVGAFGVPGLRWSLVGFKG